MGFLASDPPERQQHSEPGLSCAGATGMCLAISESSQGLMYPWEELRGGDFFHARQGIKSSPGTAPESLPLLQGTAACPRRAGRQPGSHLHFHPLLLQVLEQIAKERGEERGHRDGEQ